MYVLTIVYFDVRVGYLALGKLGIIACSHYDRSYPDLLGRAVRQEKQDVEYFLSQKRFLRISTAFRRALWSSVLRLHKHSHKQEVISSHVHEVCYGSKDTAQPLDSKRKWESELKLPTVLSLNYLASLQISVGKTFGCLQPQADEFSTLVSNFKARRVFVVL